jgi:hypothetical protein
MELPIKVTKVTHDMLHDMLVKLMLEHKSKCNSSDCGISLGTIMNLLERGIIVSFTHDDRMKLS